jgi:hypothetical protein
LVVGKVGAENLGAAWEKNGVGEDGEEARLGRSDGAVGDGEEGGRDRNEEQTTA